MLDLNLTKAPFHFVELLACINVHGFLFSMIGVGVITSLFRRKRRENRDDNISMPGNEDRVMTEQVNEVMLMFNSLMLHLPQRISLKNYESTYVACNKTFADDLNLEEDEIAGKSDYDFFPRRLADKYRADDRRVVATGKNLVTEEEYILRDCSKIINTRKIPINGNDGTVQYILVISEDITKNKQTEHALREKDEQFRSLIQQAADAIILTDQKGKIIDVNNRACETLGYTTDELLAENMRRVDPFTWTDKKPPDIWQEVDVDRPVTYETRFHRKDGSIYPVEISMGLLRTSGRNLVLSIARDITPRHLALKRSASLGTIIEDSLSEIYVLSRDSLTFVQVNHGARKNIGYTINELREKTITEISINLTRSQLRRLTHDLLTGQKDKITFETVFIRKDRTTYPVEVNLQLAEYLYQPVYVLHVQDLTRRKEYERQLSRAQEIINNSTSVAFIWSNEPGWPVKFVSQNVEKLFGYPAAEFLTHNLLYSEIIHTEDLDRVSSELKTAAHNRDQESINHEPYRIVTRDNAIKWVAVQTYITRDRNREVSSFQGIVEDITVLKEQEIALRFSKEEWERTFNAFSDMVTILDIHLRIIKVNKAGSELFRLPQEKIIGKHCHSLFRGSETPCHDCPVSGCLDTFKSYTKEMFHEGLGKTLLVSTSPVIGDDGNIGYIVHVAKDISERKKIEQQLFLSEKMTTIASLAAGVAHEINTPLSAILQSAQVIQSFLSPANPENHEVAAEHQFSVQQISGYCQDREIDYFLEGIRKSAVKASKIITSLLDFSRPRQGQMIEADLNELIDSALELAHADYDLKKKYDILNVRINRDYQDNLPAVRCIPMEIEQVILNLLKNAIHAMADNKDKKESPHIHIRTYAAEGQLYIELEDNGPGISKDIQQYIFDPFFTTKDVGVGTGLGLSVSYTIITEKHGGRIWVDPDQGKGATFKIKLPLSRKDNAHGDITA